jgi:hypothetical protein
LPKAAADIDETPNGMVAADTRTVPADTLTGSDMAEAVTGVDMLETPMRCDPISKTTELTTAVEKNKAPVSKKFPSAAADIELTPNGMVAADTRTVPVDTPTGSKCSSPRPWRP